MNPKALPILTERTYCNPLQIDYDKQKAGLEEIEACSNADPYVMKYCGEYYCYSTGMKGVHVLRSRDMIRYTHLGYALQVPGEEDYWAPCVFYDNGRFYMYYSANPAGETDNHYHYLKLAVADKPEGPFRFVRQFTDIFAIDPHVVRDTDGQLYMFYSINTPTSCDPGCAGTSIVVDRMPDCETLEGKPELVIPPSLEEEIFQRNRFGDGRDWHTVEGAFYLEKHGNAYVMYSGNAFLSPYYFVGYSTAKKDGSISGLRWKKHTRRQRWDPLISQTGHVMGTGHNSVVKAPNNIDDWIVYHGRDTKLEEGDPWYEIRIMRMDPLFWGHRRMLTCAPTHTEQDAPALPAYRSDFADNGLRGLKIHNGDWSVRDGCAIQTRYDAFASLTLASVNLHCHHTEAWLKWNPHHMGGRYGLYGAWAPGGEAVLAELHVGRRALRLYAVRGGIVGSAREAQLPPSFRFDCWHKLTVRRTGSHFSVLVDDLPLLSDTVCTDADGVGIFSAHTSLYCASLETTGYLELNRDNGDGFLSRLIYSDTSDGAGWAIQEHRLCGQSNAGLIRFRDVPDSYRLSCTLEVSGRTGGLGSGICACCEDDRNGILALLQPDQERLVILRRENGSDTICAELPCQDNPIALLARKHRNRLSILADGIPVWEGDALGQSCGFYASQPVSFDGIELLDCTE